MLPFQRMECESDVEAEVDLPRGHQWPGLTASIAQDPLAMIISPHGEILAESRALGDDVVVGLLTDDEIEKSSAQRYLKARRPELYAKMVEPQESVTSSGSEVHRR